MSVKDRRRLVLVALVARYEKTAGAVSAKAISDATGIAQQTVRKDLIWWEIEGYCEQLDRHSAWRPLMTVDGLRIETTVRVVSP